MRAEDQPFAVENCSGRDCGKRGEPRRLRGIGRHKETEGKKEGADVSAREDGHNTGFGADTKERQPWFEAVVV